MVTSFNGLKSQQNRIEPSGFFTMTIPHAQGEYEGWISPSESRCLTSWLAFAAFSGVILRAPSRWGKQSGSSRIRCFAILHFPMSALNCMNTMLYSSMRSSSCLLASSPHVSRTSLKSGVGTGWSNSGSKFSFFCMPVTHLLTNYSIQWRIPQHYLY